MTGEKNQLEKRTHRLNFLFAKMTRVKATQKKLLQFSQLANANKFCLRKICSISIFSNCVLYISANASTVSRYPILSSLNTQAETRTAKITRVRLKMECNAQAKTKTVTSAYQKYSSTVSSDSADLPADICKENLKITTSCH